MKKITSTLALFLAVCMIAVTMSGCLFHRHTIVDDEPIAPTCTVDGLTGASHCSECGKIINVGTVVPATGHTPAEDAAEDPTCSVTGKTAGSHCSVCHAVLTAQTVLEKLPHNYYASGVEKAFTCTTDGIERFTCSVCKDFYTAPLPRHTYNSTDLFDLASDSVVEITASKDGKQISLGSGFVISADGKIVTNYHVIDRASSVEVKIGDETYDVKTIEAYDISIDIAILKINARNLHFLPICKEEHKTGSTVYAFGSSQGFTATFTNGIITNAGREVEGVLCVQHNAAISSGNSGGPLLNEYGEIIGVNAFTIEESQNLNFAISVKELGNLEHNKPMTVEAVRLAESNPFLRVYKYLMKNGEKVDADEEYDVYGIAYEDTYSADRSVVMYRTFAASENEIQHYMYWDLLSEDMTIDTAILINKEDGVLYMFYTDSDGNEIDAVIEAGGNATDIIIDPVELRTITSADAEEIADLFFSSHILVAKADIQTAGTTLDDLMTPPTS